MICPNCKKEIDDDSKFCEFCGSKINTKKQLNEYDEKIKRLEEKIWFRMLKVTYILLFLASTIFGVILIFKNNYPAKKYPNLSESKIECRSKINKQTFSFWDADVSPRINQENGSHSWSDWDKHKIEGLCKDKYYYQTDNFHTHLVTETKGGIKGTIFYSILCIVGIVIPFKLIKIIFFYIILGSKKPRK